MWMIGWLLLQWMVVTMLPQTTKSVLWWKKVIHSQFKTFSMMLRQTLMTWWRVTSYWVNLEMMGGLFNVHVPPPTYITPSGIWICALPLKASRKQSMGSPIGQSHLTWRMCLPVLTLFPFVKKESTTISHFTNHSPYPKVSSQPSTSLPLMKFCLPMPHPLERNLATGRPNPQKYRGTTVPLISISS